MIPIHKDIQAVKSSIFFTSYFDRVSDCHVNILSYTDNETIIKYTGSKQKYSKHIAVGINYNYNSTALNFSWVEHI